ncbi:hypothetical protein K438DRAFT_1968532 [Mycena galopus ATCC 62051]|nr:hypothetical protein K438DRAFT_1968532 [Mycena galopus ATCC 62051]
MPAERSRGSRRTGADGDQLVWTEPALAPGIAFATTLTPGAFEPESPCASQCGVFSAFDFEPPTLIEMKPEPEPATPAPTTTFFFFDAPPSDESKPKRAARFRLCLACGNGCAHPRSAHPRPPNAFILFRSSFIRAGAVPAHIESSHASLSSIAGLTWAKLPEPEKALWYARAKEERERHRERFPGYAFRPRHRTTSTTSAANSASDADCEDSGGGGTDKEAKQPRKRQQREVPPADRARQAHIASLLLTGLSGSALDEAIGRFDAERKERGEGGMEVRFGAVETPEGRMEGCEKVKAEKETAVRRSTGQAQKRRASAKATKTKEESKDTTTSKRRRVLPPSTPIDTTSPFAFAFDNLSPSTPVDDFAFDWPYASSPSPSSPATPWGFPLLPSTSPPRPALRRPSTPTRLRPHSHTRLPRAPPRRGAPLRTSRCPRALSILARPHLTRSLAPLRLLLDVLHWGRSVVPLLPRSRFHVRVLRDVRRLRKHCRAIAAVRPRPRFGFNNVGMDSGYLTSYLEAGADATVVW